MAAGKYELIVVGTGFASSFFLLRALKKLDANAKVLVLEAGRKDPHHWQMQNYRNASIRYKDTYINQTPRKPWIYSPGYGGSSNCWWGCAPRMLPSDFEMKTKYGVAEDWPVSYNDLEEAYCDAEDGLLISGPSDSPVDRSRPFPQPPHNITNPDKILKKAYPDSFFVQPSARARVATKGRAPCCATGTCQLCPINSKFTIQNELDSVYQDPRVELHLEARALEVMPEGNLAKGVRYLKDGREVVANGDVVVLGANAIFNPFILMKSGLTHERLGRNLCEQRSIGITVDLDGVDNFQGSTSGTGLGYLHYDGEHRKTRAASLVQTLSVPRLRHEKGRWRQRMEIGFSFDNLPHPDSRITFDKSEPLKPVIHWGGDADYALKSFNMVDELVGKFTDPLPVEKIYIPEYPVQTESHNLCTTPMGNDPSKSIVDKHLVHHKVRNLLVLGGGAFPSISPSNPTLTISALSLWAAKHFYG